MNDEPTRDGKTLDPSHREALADRVKATSLAQVARESRIGEMSITKMCAGLPVQRGTVALAKDYLGA